VNSRNPGVDVGGPLRARAFTELSLQRESTAQQVANVIRDELLRGLVPPSARLSDEALAATLGVSRNTVREGIQILVSEGLVQRTMHRGAIVKEITADDLTDIYQTRRVLELAALQAAADAGPDWLETIHKFIRLMRDAVANGDEVELMRSDLAFHEAIIDALRSQHLSRFYRTLQAEIRLSKTWHGGRVEPEVMLLRHMELVDTLDARDFNGAIRQLRALIDSGEARLRPGLDANYGASGQHRPSASQNPGTRSMDKLET
jgi:DNA-binding GntR family transcriptional regulator